MKSPAGLAAVAAGNALAFYDFQTFAFFAVQIGHHFFPQSSSARALLLTLGTFGVGFVARPIGAIVIGRYADRAGREPAMVLSFGLMGVAVVLLALTPSAAKIGVAAPILLVILRLLQGFAVGGELGPAIAFLLEAAPPHRRGLFTSIQSATQGAAILLAGAVGFCLASSLSAAAFEDWGWRIALMIGGLILPVALYIRGKDFGPTYDTEQLLANVEQPHAISPRVIVAGILLLAALAIATNVRTYIATYTQDSLHLTANLAFGATIAQGLGAICLAPLAGLMTDQFGRKRLALRALLLSAAIGIPGFVIMVETRLPWVIYAVTFAMSAIGTLISVAAITLLAESMPKASRAGALGILYAAAIAVFGGSTQFIVKWLSDRTGSALAPAWYQTVALLIGAVAIAFVHETVPIHGAAKAATRARALYQRWICWIAVAALASIPSGYSWAQHASDNPVASAQDAYGLTLGLETIGLYFPFSVRGFNPQAAGNVRINGLFFDQQGPLSNRVIEGSTVRVGVSEIGYVFPAPTGIVDYDLRHAGNGSANATIVASAGPFEARGLSIDANLPVISAELQIPIGVSHQVSTQTFFGANQGYTSNITSVGATPQWSPTDRLTVRLLVDWQETRRAKTFPFIFTAGDFLPPIIPRDYMGQDWAEGRALAENFGGMITFALSGTWSFAAGVFRSVSDSPASFSDFYINTEPSGFAEHTVVAYPDQNAFSTSGEARLIGHFSHGSWGHEVVLLARGRNTVARYGGSDAVDVGPADISNPAQVPQPTFTFLARTQDHAELWGVGAAYRAHWQERADFALGVQQESYNKVVTLPPTPEVRLTDRPLRGYANADLTLTKSLTAYAGFTQGLEDSGVVPSVAVNRGAILPAARTWQLDSGIRYVITPALKLITGVFEIQKPYFNLDAGGIDRSLGVQVAKGIEMSISGELSKALNITAGLLRGAVRVIGPDLAVEGVGPVAFGQPRLTYVVNADYGGFKWPNLSVDLNISHIGASPASVDNALYSQAFNQLDFGGRYRFSLAGKAATLRAQILNLSNARAWSTGYSSGFFQQSPRSLVAYLTADF